MIVGITGSIATGKSTVSAYMKAQGFTVIDADVIAKQLLQPNSPFLARVVAQFGQQILTPTGELDRKKLAHLIFNDEVKREQLNQILHPAILSNMQIQTQMAMQRGEKTIFWDVPLLFEAKFNHYVDKVMVVYTAPEEQIARLMARNQIDRITAQTMINSQWSITDKSKLADILIDNTGTVSQTYQQAERWLTNVR